MPPRLLLPACVSMHTIRACAEAGRLISREEQNHKAPARSQHGFTNLKWCLQRQRAGRPRASTEMCYSMPDNARSTGPRHTRPGPGSPGPSGHTRAVGHAWEAPRCSEHHRLSAGRQAAGDGGCLRAARRRARRFHDARLGAHDAGPAGSPSAQLLCLGETSPLAAAPLVPSSGSQGHSNRSQQLAERSIGRPHGSPAVCTAHLSSNVELVLDGQDIIRRQ